jgi:hypothetical protein
LETVDEAEHDLLISKVAADAADLLAKTRRERDRRRANGEDVAWLDRALDERRWPNRHTTSKSSKRSAP